MDLLVAPDRAPSPAVERPALPWAEIARWALLGTLALVLFVAVDVARHGGRNPVSLIQPGTEGPSAEVIARDFPDVQPPEGLGLDGQQYYVIARDPAHLDDNADHLDNPRYRYQRILLPAAAWALHPTGGGTGMVWALALVGTLGIAAGAVATGVLSTHWRGPAWLAAIFPILPGAYWSLRVTVSDALALALAVVALALAARERPVWAVLAGVAAVLAKEPMVLLFVGWALHRRTRRDWALVVIPGVVAAAWMAMLALALPPDVERAQDLGLPLVGLVRAWTDVWSDGRELVGMACTLGALAVGGVALWRRGLRHPLGWALAIQVAFLLVLGVNPASITFGAARMAMAPMLLAVLVLATPLAAAQPVRVDDDAPQQGETGRSGPGAGSGGSSNR